MTVNLTSAALKGIRSITTAAGLPVTEEEKRQMAAAAAYEVRAVLKAELVDFARQINATTAPDDAKSSALSALDLLAGNLGIDLDAALTAPDGGQS